MKKAFLLLLLATSCFADGISSRLNITEEDGSPSTYPYQARFTNGTVTDNGDGTVSISNSGGGGGGGASGQINNANTYQVPYYSVSGSSNVVSGASDLNAFPSSVTVTGSLGLTNTYGITTATITISTVSYTNEIPYRGSGGYLVANSSFTYGEDLGGTAGYENFKLEGLSPFIIMASSNALGREFFDGYHIYTNAHMWGGDIFHPNAFPSIAQGNWNPYVRDGGFYAIDTTGQGTNDKGFFAYRVAHPADEASPRTVFQANTTGQFLIDNTYENCTPGSATDQSCKIESSIMFLTSSTTRGAVPCPRMTTTQRNAISGPSNGLCVYDMTVSSYSVYSSPAAAWYYLGTGGGGSGITALTGDVTASGSGSVAATLASIITANQFGSATVVPVITYDAKGRITAVSSATFSAASKPPITFTWDGGGVVISSVSNSLARFTELPYAVTITSSVVSCSVGTSFTVGTSTFSVTVSTQSASSFNASSGYGSICASACPALASQARKGDGILTGWVTSLNAGEYLWADLSAVPQAATYCQLQLWVQ